MVPRVYWRHALLSVKINLLFGREELSAVEAQVRAEALAQGFDAKTAASLVYVVEEIGANVLVHSGAHWLEVRFQATDNGAVLCFLDDGEEFDPIEAAQLMDAPVISEFVTGHLGLWTLKRLPFKQTWRRNGNVNELSFSVIRAGHNASDGRSDSSLNFN